MQSPRHHHPSASPQDLSHPRSGGAVIIITLTLLSTMVFLGFFFFEFTNNAQKTALAYAEAEDYEIDPEPIFDNSFEQLLVGVRAGSEESSLWGNKHSILPHIVGPIDSSLRPKKDALYSGTGIALVVYDHTPADPNTYTLSMDYDGDGIGDDLDGDGFPDAAFVVDISTNPPTYTVGFGLRLNYSRVAQSDRRNDAFNSLPNVAINNVYTVPDYDPAAGYTYPDFNSMFLGFDGVVNFTDGSGNLLPRRVVIPSFFRPQLMMHSRDANGDNPGGPGLDGFANIFTSTQTRTASFRPHQFHTNYNNVRRFVQPTGTTVAQSGNTNRVMRPFPFQVDVNLDGRFNEFGVFSDLNSQLYEYDFDADNDGVRDSIWMDLGLQMIDLPDGRQVVPLVAFKVLDSDGLFNVNVHGNLAGAQLADLQSLGLLIDHNQDAAYQFGDVYFPVHRSNQGLSPTEVNISYGLFGMTNTLSGPAEQKLLREFQEARVSPASFGAFPRQVTSAAEVFFLLTGRIPSGTSQALPGRHGEPNLLLEYYNDPTSQPRPRAGLTQAIPVAPPLDGDNDHDFPSSGGLGYTAANGTAKPYLTPPAVHPLAVTGTGAEYIYRDPSGTATPHGGVRRLSTPVDPNNPSTWPTYASGVSGHWPDQGRLLPTPTTSIYGVLPYTNAGPAGNGLQTAAAATDPYDLIDEDGEVTASSQFPDPADAMFAPSENARLQLTDADYQLSKESSRLEELLPFNFRDSATAAASRKLFGTDSWDRTEFSNPFPVSGGFRPGEFNRWTDPEFVAGNRALPQFNGFEFYDDGGSPGTFDIHFPPEFGTGSTAAEIGADVATNIDPYRRELRQLLWTRSRANLLNAGTDSSGRPNFKATRDRSQHRLNINQLLAGFDTAGNPLYRDPVPHPVFEPDDRTAITQAPFDTYQFPAMYHGQHGAGQGEPPNISTTVPTPAGSVPAFSTINDSTLAGRLAMEWWARYDRQRMARDIYVLLWTLSGGNDAINYTQTLADTTADDPDTSGFEADTFDPSTAVGKRRVREMAQFAVNFVDALDRDSVVTRFEYDTNLTNGWGDNGGADFDVVYGVEQQQLAFSEVMHIIQPRQSGDLNSTYHREDRFGPHTADDTMAHQFLYIELRNTSPFSVPLDDGTWRIARVRSGQSAIDANIQASVELQARVGPPRAVKPAIQPGANFTIACHDGTVENASGQAAPSTFFADINAGQPGLESVVPRSATTVADSSAAPPLPLFVDLDLNSSEADHADFISLRAYTSPAGDPKYDGSALVGRERYTTDPDNVQFDLVLQRRRNLNAFGIGERLGAVPEDPEAPDEQMWVEVDRFEVRTDRELQITADTPAGVLAGFEGTPVPHSTTVTPIHSQERRQPFDARQVNNTDTGAQKHSINDVNDPNNRHASNFADIKPSDPAQTTYTLWQPHFDRPFSSVIELLSLPLYGYSGNSAAGNDAATREPNDRFFVGGPTQNLAAVISGAQDAKMIGHRTAAIRFLYPQPQLPGGTGSAPTALAAAQPDDFIHYRNRWYRLLEFLEVPDQAEGTAQGRMTWRQRVPGKINLNTVRDEAVLAGLLDDPLGHFDYVANPQALTNDRFEGAARNWNNDLRLSRDQNDPVLAAALISAPIPGNLDSRPFRPKSYVSPTNADQSVEQTVLRAREFSATAEVKHGLFEARTLSDVTDTGAVAEDAVDFHTKNRLLAKVHNRTTNRSHVFFVWAGIGFFEAHRESGPNAGVVQIGAQAEDIPVRRCFMVCDMSRIEEAYDDPDPTDNIPGSFDFRKFIIYRKLIK